MAERKKWDKQSDFHPQPMSGNGGATSAVEAAGLAAANDPVLEKQRQYIKMLEERNRLKKRLAAASKTQKEKDVLQEREEAFVTTFNVPKSAAHHHHHHHHSSSGAVVRKNKSAVSLLPTRMAQPTAVSGGKCFSEQSANDRQSQCKSAPSTTLHFQRGGTELGDAIAAKSSDEQRSQQQPERATRAKWSRPQGPMNIAVENRDGKAHMCLTDANSAANPSPQHMSQGNNHDPPRLSKDGRPMTAAVRPANRGVQKSIDSWVSDGEPQQKSPVLDKVVGNDHEEDDDRDDESLVRGRRITIKLLTAWGDLNYIGLTQLDVLVGKNGVPYPHDLSQVDATPRDLESLIDGVGTTCDDTHMWLVPLSISQEIRIDLKKEQYIYGLRVWNYNKSPEDTLRGVKQTHVFVDGVLVSPKASGFLVRKAPGIALFGFDQVIKFDPPSSGKNVYLERIQYPFQSRTYKTPIVKQDYEPSLFPQGFLLKFIFWTTWGDPYYLGLNGMEIYDYNGKKLQLAPQVITAKPYSIAEISKASGSASEDVRIPENLLNGRNKNTWDASDAWLAPLASSLGKYEGNIVYVAFDFPIVISIIKFWNYSKTPERGVKDMDIYLDDLHLYSGTLRKAPSGGDGHHLGRLGTKVQVTEEFSQPTLFTTNQAQVDQEKRKVYYCGMEEQDVLCINEGQVMQESKAMYRKPDPGAEGVVVDLGLRPTTALCRH
ncbi:hypothetical protein FI667_g9622, partial [Globisporangium splendens]